MAIGHNVGPNPAAITPLGGLYAPASAPGPVANPVPQIDDPPRWSGYAKYQGGALDLAVNVALLALVVAPAIVRAPLYVTAPTPKSAVQIEQTVNVAARAPAAIIQTPTDPVFFARKPPQIDLAPNLAAKTEVVPTTRAPFVMAYKATIAQQPDIPVNIAVRSTPSVFGPFVEPTFYRRIALQLDLPANVAIRSSYALPPISDQTDLTFYPRSKVQPDLTPNLAAKTEVVPVTRAPLTVNQVRTVPPAPDLYPNLAVRVLPLGKPAAPAPEPTFTKPVPAAPDLYPNLAAKTETVPTLRAPLDVTATPRQWAQFDQVVNLAVFASASGGVITAFDDLPRSRWPLFDLSPNLAIATQAPPGRIPAPVEPTLTARRWAQLDLPPNVAIRVPLVVAPFNATPEPVYTKRLAPQIEIFRNVVIYAPPPGKPVPPPLDLPVKAKIGPIPDIFPNLAAKTEIVPIMRAPLVVNVPTKRYWTQPDVLPNAAVYVKAGTGIITAFDDLPRNRWFAFEHIPNLAVYFTAPASAQLVMPNLVGLLIWEAINVLIQNGNIIPIGAPSPLALGYFTPYPVSVKWLISSLPINTVFAQSIAAGTVVIPNAPITLSVSRTPFGASWPGG